MQSRWLTSQTGNLRQTGDKEFQLVMAIRDARKWVNWPGHSTFGKESPENFSLKMVFTGLVTEGCPVVHVSVLAEEPVA